MKPVVLDNGTWYSYKTDYSKWTNFTVLPTEDENGNPVFAGLNEERSEQFHGHLMETIYGQVGSPLEADIIALKSGDIPVDQMTKRQKDYLLTDITVPKITGNTFDKEATQEKGSGNKSRKIFPELEKKGFINVNGVLYYITGHTIDDRAGDDNTEYNLVNVNDGTTKVIGATEHDMKDYNNKIG